MIKQGAVSVQVGETDALLTNFAGAAVFANLAEELGLFRKLDESLPAKGRNYGFANSACVFDLMSIPLCGGSCIDDLEHLRRDKGLELLLGRKVMAPSTAHDFLRRISYNGLEGLEAANRHLLNETATRLNLTTATLDCDASLFVSSGKNASMSYKGERGYTPMFAFWDEARMVVLDDFRNGNASPGGEALLFLQQALAQLPEQVATVNVRSDSAWYQAEIMNLCDSMGHGFCIGANMDSAVMDSICAIPEEAWSRIDLISDPSDPMPDVREDAAETIHSLGKTKRAYRLIVTRKERMENDLFYGPYTYHAIITNMDLPFVDQLDWYRKRGRCEQRIGELKWDFELRVLPSGDFFVNAVYMRIITLAYNLFSALKLMKLPESCHPLRLKTLWFRLLKIPALVVRHARRLTLRFPRGHPGVQDFAAVLS